MTVKDFKFNIRFTTGCLLNGNIVWTETFFFFIRFQTNFLEWASFSVDQAAPTADPTSLRMPPHCMGETSETSSTQILARFCPYNRYSRSIFVVYRSFNINRLAHFCCLMGTLPEQARNSRGRGVLLLELLT